MPDIVPLCGNQISIVRAKRMTRFEETNWGDAARTKEYRDNADHYVPERQLLVSVLASFYRHSVTHPGTQRVLDLGCGDGIVGATLCSVDPAIRLCAIDGSEDMLKAARRRLANARVELLSCATFQQIIRGEVELGIFDFVASAFAIHHVDLSEKKVLFRCILTMLKSGCCFANLDVILPRERHHEDWYYDLWREWIQRHRTEVSLSESFAHVPAEARRKPENFYDSLEDQLDALRHAGFTEVECHYRHGLFGIYSGRKP